VGWIGTLRRPDLARGPYFGNRYYKRTKCSAGTDKKRRSWRTVGVVEVVICEFLFFAIPVSLFHHFYAEFYICVVIKMPPHLKRGGRPKGHDLTVVGLPRKKRCRDRKGPPAFAQRYPSEKKKSMFLFFCTQPH